MNNITDHLKYWYGSDTSFINKNFGDIGVYYIGYSNIGFGSSNDQFTILTYPRYT
ncbi:MAG: hypothetical protein R2771_03225 [Saprospiraceae bacterium]